MDESVFKEQMLMLGVSFDKELTTDLLKVYRYKLEHLTNEQITTAVNLCIDQLTFFPKIAEILQRAPKVVPPPQLDYKGKLEWCQNTQQLLNNYPTKWSLQND